MSECLACGGLTVLEKVNVERWWKGRLVIIEGVPAHVCQQCGERYFDSEVALKMDRIVRAAAVPGEKFIQVPVRPFGNIHAPQDSQ
ncbi:YgiT-type zinc finger domain-containing protein [Thermanaeromonas toyohensis ToBE]|uniref:YgiT-type zinc finger domain-containing protein n=1 Tax=Thermanaeromonas toyohensis ToBE TaxID=698762 RepID=A0A1W1VA55_9FIRM|nr:type II toxin-antitoxin system MqsA family antitoxin [Thermanaeromonas toyohensis]SMB90238.1 YgiT-type zinc finger domain-containing protein [Thermanaeromonas toyohensis ToBE]